MMSLLNFDLGLIKYMYPDASLLYYPGMVYLVGKFWQPFIKMFLKFRECWPFAWILIPAFEHDVITTQTNIIKSMMARLKQVRSHVHENNLSNHFIFNSRNHPRALTERYSQCKPTRTKMQIKSCMQANSLQANSSELDRKPFSCQRKKARPRFTIFHQFKNPLALPFVSLLGGVTADLFPPPNGSGQICCDTGSLAWHFLCISSPLTAQFQGCCSHLNSLIFGCILPSSTIILWSLYFHDNWLRLSWTKIWTCSNGQAIPPWTKLETLLELARDGSILFGRANPSTPKFSKYILPIPFEEKCTRKWELVVESYPIWICIWESQVLHTVWCNISGKAGGEIWNWSALLGVTLGCQGWPMHRGTGCC